MSKAHLDQLKSELKKSKWVIRTYESAYEFIENWEITKPNGDCPLNLIFTMYGNGKYGDCIGNETMENANGCSVESHPEIDIYFGKFSGQFQKDLAEFIAGINQLEKQSYQ